MGDGMDCLPGMRVVEASMAGKSTLTADAAEQATLRALSKSEERGEADRARAILLTLEGRKAEEIAAVLGVHVSTVRNWRGYFAHGGVAGLRRRPRLGGQSVVGLDVAAPVRRNCPAWRTGDLAAVAVAPTAPKGFVWTPPTGQERF